MTTEPEVIPAAEVMRRIGLKKSRFYALEKQGKFRMLEVSRPIGTRRYARVLVDRYVAGESVSQYGKRRV